MVGLARMAAAVELNHGTRLAAVVTVNNPTCDIGVTNSS
jgi:hypothetical protein